MWKILFPAKSFHKRGGGQIKSRDYLLHCLAHPQLDPYVYFTDAALYQEAALWAGVPKERVLERVDVAQFDLFFISGRNWKYVPKQLQRKPVINLLQSISECSEGAPEARYFRRPALRICVSQGVADASAPYRNGDAFVIPNGIPLDIFRPAASRREGSVLIWGRKDGSFGVCLREELARRGVTAELLIDYLPREIWAGKLAETDVFVGLPHAQEGFFLPALEAMASGASVVCAGATGNESFCLPDRTCLSPAHRDLMGHVEAVERLLTDNGLSERVRLGGIAMAPSFSLEAERARFYRLLDERVFPLLA